MSQTPRTKPNLIERMAAQCIQYAGLKGFVGRPEKLFEHPEVTKWINDQRPATLGVLAWKGLEWGKEGDKTSLYHVHCGSYLNKHDGGKKILRNLAKTALVAEIFDQLGRPYPNWRANLQENGFPPEEAAYIDMMLKDPSSV